MRCGLAAVILLLTAVSARAEAVKVAIPELAGFVEIAADGTAHGPIIDLMQDIEAASGLTFDISAYPFKRVLHMVENGDADIGVMVRTEQRDVFAQPLFQVASSSVVAVSRRDRPIRQVSDFDGLTVGALRGGLGPPEEFSERIAGVYRVDNHQQGLRMVLAGRLDATIMSDFRLRDILDKTDTDTTMIDSRFVVGYRDFWVYWSRQSAESSAKMSTIRSTGLDTIGDRPIFQVPSIDTGS